MSGRQEARGAPRFVALTVGVVVLAALGLSLVFHGAGDFRAVWVSGTVAVVVQILVFALVQRVAPSGSTNLTARMGMGALVRFLALVAYAVLVATATKLPPTAALISLVVFFFLTTFIEPLFIRS